jgi:predicted O-methyltransferase YrrM
MLQDLAYLQSPPTLASIKARTTELEFTMASEPLVGAMLRLLVASKPQGRFLELGTGTGLATAWLLQGMDAKSTLVSIDTDEAVQQVARE